MTSPAVRRSRWWAAVAFLPILLVLLIGAHSLSDHELAGHPAMAPGAASATDASVNPIVSVPDEHPPGPQSAGHLAVTAAVPTVIGLLLLVLLWMRRSDPDSALRASWVAWPSTRRGPPAAAPGVELCEQRV